MNIQMKPLQQYLHVVLFVLYVVLTFESVEKCYSMNIQMKTLQQHFHISSSFFVCYQSFSFLIKVIYI